ncbi:MAG: STAS domain-containing protein [Solirubrobacteraceae bacterium]
MSELPDPLRIERHEEAGRVRVAVSGELDLATVDELRAELDALAADRQPVLLDLGELAFIDSSGLALLLAVRTEAAATGWPLVIGRQCSAPVRRAMEITGVETLLLGSETR